MAGSGNRNLTPQALNDAYIEVKSAFVGTFDHVDQEEMSVVKKLSFSDTTPDDTITYQWLDDRIGPFERSKREMPRFRRLTGNRFDIELRSFDDGVEIDHSSIAGDRLGMYMQKAMSLGRAAAESKIEMLIDILENGETSAYNMYDNLPYFDNAHPRGGTTYDNLLGTLPFNQTNYQTVRTAMARFPSDDGSARPIGIRPTDIIAPPDIELNVLEVLRGTSVIAQDRGVTPVGAGPISNQLVGTANAHISGRLTDVNDWYAVADIPGMIKPLVYVKKESLNSENKDFYRPDVYVDGLNTFEDAFKMEVLRVWWRTYEVLYPTHPFLAIKVVN